MCENFLHYHEHGNAAIMVKHGVHLDAAFRLAEGCPWKKGKT